MPLIRIRDVVRGYSDTFYTGEYKSDYIIENGDALIGMDGEFNSPFGMVAGFIKSACM